MSYEYHLICGIDEAGRGAWAGPVYATAVILPDLEIPHDVLLRDSKTLSPPQRNRAAKWLWNYAMIGVGFATVEEIDEFNILAATMCAMQRAYADMDFHASRTLVDGNQLPKLDCPTESKVRGDSLYPQIAAASIIAKTMRDASMYALATIQPHYAFDRHKGYGTPMHIDALHRYGASGQHRRSFRPVRDACDARAHHERIAS